MISEQMVIDILFFFLHHVVQHVGFNICLILMLTPKYKPLPLTIFLSVAVMIIHYFTSLSTSGVSVFLMGILTFLAPALIFFKDPLRKRIFAALIISAFLFLMDMIMGFYTLITLGYFPAKSNPPTWMSVVFTLQYDIAFVVGFIPVFWLWNKKVKKYALKSMSYFMLFPVGQMIFMAACAYPAWFSGSEFKVFDNPFMLLALIISLISDVLMFVALRDNDNLQRTRGRVAEMEKQMELQLQYYDNLADKFTEIREYRHDINNLVSVAEALINDTSSESSKAFIGEMKEKALNMKVPMFCENSIVNAVLWKKQNETLEKGLEFTAEIDRAEQFPLDRIDVCSLLANLLDNAIREAEEPGGFVRILIGRKHGLLIIDVSNSTLREHSGTEKLPKTTKDGDHGHGMEIAEKIARKYNGKFVFKAHEGVAHAIVSLMT